MLKRYMLNGITPVPYDGSDWAEWTENNADARQVAATKTENGYYVSTIFVGVDVARPDDPELFESMVWAPDGRDIEVRRYKTWAEAEQGHQELVEACKFAGPESGGL